MINELSKSIHEWARPKGFSENETDINKMLELIHDDVRAALDAHNEGCFVKICITDAYALYETPQSSKYNDAFENEIKDTFEDKLADIMIRVMDAAALKGIDLESHIKLKSRYNSFKEYKRT